MKVPFLDKQGTISDIISRSLSRLRKVGGNHMQFKERLWVLGVKRRTVDFPLQSEPLTRSLTPMRAALD